MADKKRIRKNFPAQEKVVKALWQFAAKIQAMKPGEHNVRSDDGTRLKLADVDDALIDIMEAFGYQTTEVH